MPDLAYATPVSRFLNPPAHQCLRRLVLILAIVGVCSFYFMFFENQRPQSLFASLLNHFLPFILAVFTASAFLFALLAIMRHTRDAVTYATAILSLAFLIAIGILCMREYRALAWIVESGVYPLPDR